MPPAEKTQPRLLLVDDEPDNLVLLSRRLGRMGFTAITTAPDGAAALAAVAAQPFDVLFLDIMMPGMSGIEVLERLRAEGRMEQMPVIVVSASTEIATIARCLELGAEDYLSKPINPVLLQARLGSVLEKRQLRTELRRQLDRLEAELEEARRQQLSMVPRDFPSGFGALGASVHAVLLPAREVGGDLYDVFALGEEALCLAIGDASDKGMPAAMFMARTRSLLRAAALHLHRTGAGLPAPAAVMALLNEELGKDNPACMFVTMLLGVLDTSTGVLRYVNAGHEQPYLLRARAVSVVPRAEAPEPPLGVMDGVVYGESTLTLAPGDGLVFVTDGLSDMLDGVGESFGLAGVEAALAAVAGGAAAEITAHVVACAFAFAGGTAQSDDVTMLAVRLAEAP